MVGTAAEKGPTGGKVVPGEVVVKGTEAEGMASLATVSFVTEELDAEPPDVTLGTTWGLLI